MKDVNEAQKANAGKASDEIAAIAMALHEHFNDTHDIENMVLTFKRVNYAGSPWSSKVLTLRQNPK